MLSYFLVACLKLSVLVNSQMCVPESEKVNVINPEYITPIIYLKPEQIQGFYIESITETSIKDSVIQTFIIK